MSTPVADLGRLRTSAYRAVRIVLGLSLLAAAGLKGEQLATGVVAETGLLTSRWFVIGVVESELLLGLWLLAGPYPRRTSQFAVLCFGGFACVSLYKAVSGEASCGCFGKVAVNPWYTLVFDLAAVTGLLCWRPATVPASSPRPVPAPGPRPSASSPRPVAAEGPGGRAGPRRQLACVLGICLLVGPPAALVMGSYQAATLGEAGDIFGDSEFVVLEPETWVGKRFPLLKYIDIGDRLADGKWIVVLYQHDCPKCQEALPKYEQLARGGSVPAEKVSAALVEMPPYGSPRHGVVLDGSRCLRGRLSEVNEWFVRTPVEVRINRSIVEKVAG